MENMSEQEQDFLVQYDELLEDYTAEVLDSVGVVVPEGDAELPSPLDLGRDLHRPPVSVDVDVLALRRCRVPDEQTRTRLQLEERTRTSIRRSIADPLVRTGHLMQIPPDMA
jgi:hypothetical protein